MLHGWFLSVSKRCCGESQPSVFRGRSLSSFSTSASCPPSSHLHSYRPVSGFPQGVAVQTSPPREKPITGTAADTAAVGGLNRVASAKLRSGPVQFNGKGQSERFGDALVEMNGIEPSTSCLQSTLTIVRDVFGRVGSFLRWQSRSMRSSSSAGAQTSGMRSFIRARIDQHSPVRRRTGAADGYVCGYVELGPLTSCPRAHGRSTFRFRRLRLATS